MVYSRGKCEVPTVPVLLYLDGQARFDISGQAPISEKLSTFFSTEDLERTRLKALMHLNP